MPTLTPELIATLRQLSPDERDAVRDILDEEDGPPDTRTPEAWAAEIRRRIDDVESGRVVPLTREESERQIREAIRKLGHEL